MYDQSYVLHDQPKNCTSTHKSFMFLTLINIEAISGSFIGSFASRMFKIFPCVLYNSTFFSPDYFF